MKLLHPYQIKAVEAIIYNKKYALHLGVGLGKTVITLTAIQKLLDNSSIQNILII